MSRLIFELRASASFTRIGAFGAEVIAT